MAISTGMCISFKLELLEGIHNFFTDTFYCALYSIPAGASIGPSTMVYTPTGEISGAGYNAGGNPLSLAAGQPALFGANGAGVYFNPVAWPASTIAADGALIYNPTKANRAVVVMGFNSRKATLGNTFTLAFPSTSPPPLLII